MKACGCAPHRLTTTFHALGSRPSATLSFASARTRFAAGSVLLLMVVLLMSAERRQDRAGETFQEDSPPSALGSCCCSQLSRLRTCRGRDLTLEAK